MTRRSPDSGHRIGILVLFIAFQAPPEGRGIDAQQSRGFLPCRGSGENLKDVFLFELDEAEVAPDRGGRWSASTDPLGEARGNQNLPAGQDDRALHLVPQFADVSRPRIGLEQGCSFVMKHRRRPARGPTREGEEVSRECANVLSSIAQWRDLNLDDIQPIEEIESKPPGLNVGFEIPVCGRHQPDVGAPSGGLPDTFILVVL